MPSLLPHDLCPEWNASPAPGTGSVHAQSRYQCLLSHVITGAVDRRGGPIAVLGAIAVDRPALVLQGTVLLVGIMAVIFIAERSTGAKLPASLDGPGAATATLVR